jgi:hypothetical protein
MVGSSEHSTEFQVHKRNEIQLTKQMFKIRDLLNRMLYHAKELHAAEISYPTKYKCIKQNNLYA